MKRHFLYFIIVLMLSLVAATAMADKCKPVHARLGEMVFYDPGCMLDGWTYYWCAERPVLGTLNGTYRFYSAPAFNGWDLVVPPDTIGTTGWSIGVSHVISVLETEKGTLLTQEAQVWHGGELEGWGSHFSITGGTGHYDGATGWMASAGSWDSMALVGELCTP